MRGAAAVVMAAGLLGALVACGTSDTPGGPTPTQSSSSNPASPVSPPSPATPSTSRPAGKVIGAYGPGPGGTQVRIELDRGTGRLGEQVPGAVVVRNTTGRTVSLPKPRSGQSGCTPKFGLALSRPGFTQHLAFTMECGDARILLPPGTTRLPAAVLVDRVSSSERHLKTGRYQVRVDGTDELGSPPRVPFVVTP